MILDLWPPELRASISLSCHRVVDVTGSPVSDIKADTPALLPLSHRTGLSFLHSPIHNPNFSLKKKTNPRNNTSGGGGSLECLSLLYIVANIFIVRICIGVESKVFFKNSRIHVDGYTFLHAVFDNVLLSMGNCDSIGPMTHFLIQIQVLSSLPEKNGLAWRALHFPS